MTTVGQLKCFLIFFLELDRILGDLVAQMSRVESHIMVLLMQFIRRRVPAILKAVGLVADLDWLVYSQKLFFTIISVVTDFGFFVYFVQRVGAS